MAKTEELNSGEPLPGQPDGSEGALPVQQAEWICNHLDSDGEAKFADFKIAFPQRPTEGWHHTSHAVLIALKRAGVPASRDDAENRLWIKFEGTQGKLPPDGKYLKPRHYHTKSFRPYEEVHRKRRIGELVARYLKEFSDEGKRKRWSVLLGSGSTIFEVGKAMADLAEQEGPYQQLFWTVNIALAAYWCERDRPPVEKVSIPEAVLETNSFRFATMQKPSWSPAIAVVGVDGCLYEEEHAKVTLYANEVSVANNTTVFVTSATDTVICCLASSKMAFEPGKGQNSGPPIRFPFPLVKNYLRRFLVTDEDPQEDIVAILEKDDWVIVTKPEDWRKLPPSRRNDEPPSNYPPRGTRSRGTRRQ